MSIAIIGIALILASPMLFGYKAEAAAGKRVSGQATGTVICPDGSQNPGRTLSIDAIQSNGQLNGDWNIIIPPTNANEQQGPLTGGHITDKSYSLSGNENEDGLCGEDVPVDVTITGECGQGVTLQFTADNGETGTFTGNAACS